MVGGTRDDGLAARLAADLATLEAELSEIDLLIRQATAESERHEKKRVSASDRLANTQALSGPSPEVLAQAMALLTLSRRAAVMEAQVDVLTGKRKALARFREAIGRYAECLPGIAIGPGSPVEAGEPEPGATGHAGVAAGIVLAAQEELRREIARSLHDGPAQSLTNIVLQAQIVERIVERDPAGAADEVRLLTEMVQRTLDATKSFIFDVRPMVLDDLGLVPTLRRATRDRGRRTGIPIRFESMGADRRLPTDLESGLFRLLDDGLAAFLTLHPDKVALRLDWTDQLGGRLTAERAEAQGGAAEEPERETADDLPPALAEMIAQRRDDRLAAVEEARRALRIVLPGAAWEEIRARAEGLGITAELLDEGAEVRISADLLRLTAARPA